MKKEKKIKNSTDPVSISCTEKILSQMRHSICKIKIQGTYATGFFCRTQFETNENIDFLMTNYHVIDEKYCEENKEINLLLNDDKEALVIDLTIKRSTYFNKDYDIALIELKKIDKVENFLELDDNLFKENEKIFYEEKSVYVLQYPNGRIAFVSYGLLTNINNYNITHTCSTENGSSGSPILNLENNKVIGIHKESSIAFNFNRGTFLRYPMMDFNKKNKEKKLEHNEDNRKNNELILPKIPNQIINTSINTKNLKNNTKAEKIKLDSIVIWIEKNIYSHDNTSYIDYLKSNFELKLILFKDIHNALNYMQSIYFEETKIIISGGYYKEFIEKFKEKLTDIYFAPKIIVLTGSIGRFFSYNKDYKNKENIFYAFGGVVDRFKGIIQFLQNENQIETIPEPEFPKLSEKETLSQLIKPEEGKCVFYYLDNTDDRMLPLFFKSMLDKTSTDNLDNYTRFLYNNFSKELLGSIVNMKNIPIEILSKYYARLYTWKSEHSFSQYIRDELSNGKIEKNLPYIKTLYEGVKLKTFSTSHKKILYGPEKLSYYEIDKIKRNIKNLKGRVVFTKLFLEFFENIGVAEKFLYCDLKGKDIAKVLFIMEIDNNINYNLTTNCELESVSIYKNEREVLFFPFSCFEIKGIYEKLMENEKIYEIKILYLGTYLKN